MDGRLARRVDRFFVRYAHAIIKRKAKQKQKQKIFYKNEL